MYWVLHAHGGGREFQGFDMPRLPHRGWEMGGGDFALFPAPEPGHQKNVRADAGLAQRDRLVKRSDAQPACAFSLERARALDRAVAVGVGFHYSAYGDVRAHVFLRRAEILAQGRKGNFGPGGTRRHAAQNFCGGCHFRDYSGSDLRVEVTQGLLPSIVSMETPYLAKDARYGAPGPGAT